MLSWNRLNARFGVTPALLGFNRDARPAGEEWLAAFTAAFRGPPNAAAPAPARAGARPRAVYTATGPILAAAYQTLIDRRPGPGAAPAGLAAPPALGADPARTRPAPAKSRPQEGGHE